MRKIINFDKLKSPRVSSYVFLWVILCFVVGLVHLTSMVLITKFGNLRASAATFSRLPTCSSSPLAGATIIKAGDSLAVSQRGFVAGDSIRLFGTGAQVELAKTLDSRYNTANQTITLPSTVSAGQYYILIVSSLSGSSTNCAGSPFSVVFSYPGVTACDVDFNHDGKVNADDVAIAAKYFGQVVGSASAVYDVNHDKKINSIDLAIVSRYDGQTCSLPTLNYSATNLSVSNQTCNSTGMVNVAYGWTPGAQAGFMVRENQMLDVSLTNDNFSNSYMTASNPPSKDAISYTAGGQVGPLVSGKTYFWRINTHYLNENWHPSKTASFTTMSCPASVPTPTPTPIVSYNLSQPSITCSATGNGGVNFSWNPAVTSGGSVGVDVYGYASPFVYESGPLPSGSTSWTLHSIAMGGFTAVLIAYDSNGRPKGDTSNRVVFNISCSVS